MNNKAVALLSGGMDSILAARVALEMGIDVHGIFMKTVFFSNKKGDRVQLVQKTAESINIPVSIIDIERQYMEVLRNPKHGFGRNSNPCIDCHTFFLKKAREFMPVVDATFIITGEVVGQRPMSQHMEMLLQIEKEAGCKGKVLRPLCGKLLPKTLMEEEGIIRRDDLLDLSGRTRNRQMELVREYKMKVETHSGGGCLLTDIGFGARMLDYLKYYPEEDYIHIKLLIIGRHFRLSEKVKVIVGRDQQENEKIYAARKIGAVIFPIEEIPGPTALVIGDFEREDLLKAASLVSRYSDGSGTKKIVIRNGRKEEIIDIGEMPDEELNPLRIIQ